MTQFDPTKPVQTRDGSPARIICTDANTYGGPYIVALVTLYDGRELVQNYRHNGKSLDHTCNSEDLVNVPEKKTQYYGIMKSNDKNDYLTTTPFRDSAEEVRKIWVCGKGTPWTLVEVRSIEFEV